MSDGFDQFVLRATARKYGPYPYQREIALGGLPVLCTVPTGAGKTAAAVLPWLWRLMENGPTRAVTPHRLVYVLPMRTLVEQTVGEIRTWLANLGLADKVQLHVLMGGVDRDDDAWQVRPADPAIFAGTQDMVLSRALMRGYAEPRTRWPVSFGLLHAGTQWVLDETQLLGPALGTSAQLQGLRDALGSVTKTATMWMSATLDAGDLRTPDHRLPEVDGEAARTVALGAADFDGPLGTRLNALRRFERLRLPDEAKAYGEALAKVLVERHRPGTQTIAFLNTVERATAVFAALERTSPQAELLLVHSRFRPGERARLAARLKEPVPQTGRVVVATQALEAGVDVSSQVLFTETARWSSVVQRAGRLNRAGEWPDGAELLWSPPPKAAAAPYEPQDLDAAERMLTELEGRSLTTLELQAVQVAQSSPVHAMLRRRDLLQLFDTQPDLSGADVDVGPWVRDADESTVMVAWRSMPSGRPAEDDPFAGRAELCPVPVGDIRKLLKTGRRLWAYERVSGGWRSASQGDVVPGTVLLLNAADGGYSATTGWAPARKAPVEPVGGADVDADALRKDRSSYGCPDWISLEQHLADVEREVGDVLGEYESRLAGFPEPLLDAAKAGGRFHDLGKAHPAFQAMLLSGVADGKKAPPSEGVWAKSAQAAPSGDTSQPAEPAKPAASPKPRPVHVRHELVSALMLLHPGCDLLKDESEADLVTYLAAAHHGKVRVSIRSLPDENGRVLGVAEGDRTLALDMPGVAVLPELQLSLGPLRIGADLDGSDGAGCESWTQRVLRLRDRPDLGPFRLAFLEALVRVADWRASRAYEQEQA
ncbi:hypothetical protein ACRB68_23830 [Actinomadura sp. RB68]|uniref:CRISPR-associated helicase Cas3 n=2 Tax=Actinomadura macrotermitis TaxID=2585200 RepID=A0A7K0BT22_9ACTN|nr:hypothetical protein [Actinomadura macrotermitis]